MAEKKQAADLELGEAAKSGGKKKLIIIIAAAVLLIGGGVGAFLVLKKAKPECKEGEHCEEVAEEAPAEEGEEGHGGGPIYQPMEEAIVTNLPSDKKARTLKLNVVYVCKNELDCGKVRAHMPMLRSELLVLLATTKVEEVLSPEGQQAFRDKALELSRTAMEREEKKPFIEKLLFTSFVMQ